MKLMRRGLFAFCLSVCTFAHSLIGSKLGAFLALSTALAHSLTSKLVRKPFFMSRNQAVRRHSVLVRWQKCHWVLVLLNAYCSTNSITFLCSSSEAFLTLEPKAPNRFPMPLHFLSFFSECFLSQFEKVLGASSTQKQLRR